MATLRSLVKSETFSGLDVKSHDQLKGAKGILREFERSMIF